MMKLQWLCETPLPAQCSRAYDALAFDGCSYYLLDQQCCEIEKVSQGLVPQQTIKTARPYSALCYDWCRGIFWAAATCGGCRLFKLDHCLREIDSISIKNADGGKITGLSYDCYTGNIVIACLGKLLVLDHCNTVKLLANSPNGSWITSVLALSPGVLYTTIRESGQCLCIVPPDCKQKVSLLIPEGYSIRGMIFTPCCEENRGHLSFTLLAVKNGCHNFLLECTFCPDSFPFTPYPCNWGVHQPEGCPPPPPPPPPPPHPNNGCADVLESIALMETALSHIINAEGEKLQKILATTDDFDKIMETNREITHTIIHASQLEYLLFAKLDALTRICPMEEDCGCWPEKFHNNDC